ncbi:MAG: terminase small subunit [Alphaproteobacteria bacterium]
MPITPKQDRFCREYLADLNATGAARRAGYSEATAHVQGPRLLANVRVKQRLAELQGVVAERNEITVDGVIAMLLDSYKTAKAANQHGPAVRAAELLDRRLGMFRDRLELSPADGPDDNVLIERLAKGDPAAVAVLTRLIGRPSFNA